MLILQRSTGRACPRLRAPAITAPARVCYGFPSSGAQGSEPEHPLERRGLPAAGAMEQVGLRAGGCWRGGEGPAESWAESVQLLSGLPAVCSVPHSSSHGLASLPHMSPEILPSQPSCRRLVAEPRRKQTPLLPPGKGPGRDTIKNYFIFNCTCCFLR